MSRLSLKTSSSSNSPSGLNKSSGSSSHGSSHGSSGSGSSTSKERPPSHPLDATFKQYSQQYNAFIKETMAMLVANKRCKTFASIPFDTLPPEYRAKLGKKLDFQAINHVCPLSLHHHNCTSSSS